MTVKFKLEVKILDNLPQKRTLAELLMNLALDLNKGVSFIGGEKGIIFDRNRNPAGSYKVTSR